MGKSFTAELKSLPETLEFIRGMDITPVRQFLSKADKHPLVTIGTGGSYTAAEMTKLLFNARGGMGIASTPLEFLKSNLDLRETHVLLFTAGGGNRDLLATFKAAIEREAKSVFVICCTPNSKIEKQARRYSQAKVFSYSLPSGRDGYLATNTLFSFCALMIAAFEYGLPSLFAGNKKAMLTNGKPSAKLKTLATPYYLALYEGWAKPAAIDLESKFSEAGLGGVILADYRHFAHGRHNWIDKQGKHTTVLAFITPDSTPLAERTLKLLPTNTRTCILRTNLSGPSGMLDLIIQVFQFTATVGKQIGIDPGRPGIPAYGSSIYHLGPYPIAKGQRRRSPLSLKTASVQRKLSARGTIANVEDQQRASLAYDRYKAKIEGTEFAALVVDFDGTVAAPGIAEGRLSEKITKFFVSLLQEDVPVYFVTGRGDSIHKIIKNSFAKSFWNRIYISYYNGAFTLPFTDSRQFNLEDACHEALNEIFTHICADSLLASLAKTQNKKHQVSLKINEHASLEIVANALHDLVTKFACTTLRIVQSTHSIDVIPIKRSKQDCIKFAQGKLPGNRGLLAIGDRGARPGNDFDLLAHAYSLSVDSVSTALDSCWSFLPAGTRNVDGLIRYASWTQIKSGHFRIKFPKEGST